MGTVVQFDRWKCSGVEITSAIQMPSVIIWISCLKTIMTFCASLKRCLERSLLVTGMGNSSLFAISVLFPHHHPLFEAAFGGWLGGEVSHFLCFHRHFLALRLQQFRTDLRLLFLPRVLVIGAEWRPNAEKVFGLRIRQLGGKRFF